LTDFEAAELDSMEPCDSVDIASFDFPLPLTVVGSDVLIAGIHDPDSLDGLSQTTDKCDIKFEQLLESFRISVPKFSGDVRQDHLSTRNWVRLIANWRREVLGGIDNLLFIAEIRRLLSGLAQRVIGRSVFAQPAEILSTIQREFPHGQFQRELVKLIESGEAFANCDGPELMTRLDEYIAELEDSTFGMMAIAEAIQELFPNYWEFLDLPESNITSADLIACTQEIRRRLYCSRKAKATPYDKMIVLAKPKVTESPKSALVGTSKTSSKLANPSSRNNQRRNKTKSKLNQVLDMLIKQNAMVSASGADTSNSVPKGKD
ncbi:hypothetical protein GGH99_005173, partial [Coemansia sp. RSA 1285]